MAGFVPEGQLELPGVMFFDPAAAPFFRRGGGKEAPHQSHPALNQAESLQARLGALGIIDETLHYNNGRKPIPAEYIVQTRDLIAAVGAIVGSGKEIVMIGAETSATENFNFPAEKGQRRSGLIGVQAQTLNGGSLENLPVARATEVPPEYVCKTNEIILDALRKTVRVGAGVTVAQANRAAADFFGPDFYIPLDLTTMDVAHAGAVFATGAQGPSRARPADVLRSFVLATGKRARRIEDKKEIEAHQGLWGTTGAIAELEFEVFKRPPHRFAIFVPLAGATQDNWHEKAAEVMARLSPAADVRYENGKAASQVEGVIIDGIEIFERNALQLVHNRHANTQIKADAERHLNELARANSMMGLTVTGYSHLSDEASIFSHCEQVLDPRSPFCTILKLAEAGEVGQGQMIIGDHDLLENVRLLREALPDIARDHGSAKRPGELNKTSSTDINSGLKDREMLQANPEALRQFFASLLRPYASAYAKAEAMKKKNLDVEIVNTMYGHGNPLDLNPHFRRTARAKKEAVQSFEQAVARGDAILEELIGRLAEIPHQNGDLRISMGEKGAFTREAQRFLEDDEKNEIAALLAQAPPNFQGQLTPEWRARVEAYRAAA